MSLVRFQIIFNRECDYDRLLKDTFQETLASSISQEFSEEDLTNIFTVQYCATLGTEKLLYAVELNTENASFNLSDEQIKMIGTAFQDREEIDFILKFYDQTLLDRVQHFAMEIFDLEMKLREALSFTFLMRYPDDPFNLFREVNISLPKGKNNDWLKNQITKEGRLTSRFENELFHTVFSDYPSASEIRPFREGDLLTLINNADDFEGLKQAINMRGIQGEIFQDLLAGIKEHSDPLEKLRNCIAHNREPSDNEIAGYEHAKSKTEELLESFWQKIKGTEDDE